MCDFNTEYLWDFLKVMIPVLIALYVLNRQLVRNRQMQAEATFFNLLNSVRSLVANTEGDITPVSTDTYSPVAKKRAKGVAYYIAANTELQNRLSDSVGKAIVDGLVSQQHKSEETVANLNQLAIDTYNKFFEAHYPELGHYFRFTYNVLNYVHSNSDIPGDKKRQYINFVQSQMSESELQLIYFNGVGKHGANYYRLIEEYNFLQNISTSGNQGLIESLTFYPKSSFR